MFFYFVEEIDMNRKKILGILFFSILLLPAFSETLNILSFNILGAKYNHTKENPVWMSNLAEIIKNNKADIVLLQEVPQIYSEEIEHNSFADELINLLGEDWGYRSSASYSNCSYNLNNAILYRYRSVLILREIDNSSYDFKYKNVQMVEFTLRNNYDKRFYVVNLHLPFDRAKISSPTNEMKMEMESIKNLIYDRRFPAVFGGDFNMSRREIIRETQFSNSVKYIIDGNSSIYNDEQGLLTTISTKETQGIKLSSGYDHFIVNNRFTIKKEMRRGFSELQSNNRNCSFITVGSRIYNNSESYKEYVSDHIPIIISLEF